MLRKSVFTILSSFFSFSAFAQTGKEEVQPDKKIDILGFVGYAGQTFDSTQANGYNLGVKGYYNLTQFNPIAALIVGGGLKYESLSHSTTARGFTVDLNKASLMPGVELGAKITPLPQLAIYTTLGFNYGIYNKSDVSVHPELLNAKISDVKDYNYGINAAGLYQMNSEFGLGAGVFLGKGVYEGTTTFYLPLVGEVDRSSGSDDYTAFSFNAFVSYSL